MAFYLGFGAQPIAVLKVSENLKNEIIYNRRSKFMYLSYLCWTHKAGLKIDF